MTQISDSVPFTPYSKLYILTELSAYDVKFISSDRQELGHSKYIYSYGTVNSIFVEIQLDSMNIKNDPRIFNHCIVFFTDTYEVAINKDDYSVGSSVLQIYAENLDWAEDGDQIRYSVKDDTKYIPWDYDGISRNTERLFLLNTGNY